MLPRSWLSSEKNKRIFVFCVSMLIGAFLFILIYGPYVLNPFYDDWIFTTGERDLPQHYIGFCMYRSSPWQFPLGLITTASSPHDMSVIYADAIPLFAFIFKLLNPILPQVFQYLGIYGLLSMALTGGIGALIIYEIIRGRDDLKAVSEDSRQEAKAISAGSRDAAVPIAIVSSIFYSMNWVLIYRMFYHTSLTSHWLILLAFYLWMRLDLKEHTLKNCLIYAGFSAVALLIHPYIWAMCAGITAMSLIEYLIRNKDVKKFLLYGFDFCIAGGLCLFVFGAFTGGTKASLGAGSYEANLNTFFNSMDFALLPGLPVTLLQYEGFGYLGAGVLLLVVVTAVVFIVGKASFLKKAGANINDDEQDKHKGMGVPVQKGNLRKWLYVITALCFIIFSIIPEISWGDKVLVKINLGRISRTFVGIFRSNGRFIWPVCYMLMTGVIVFIYRHINLKRFRLLLTLCLVIQIVDMTPYLAEKHGLFAKGDYEYTGILDGNKAIDDVIGRYDHIVMDIKDGEVDQYLTYYAYLHGMTTNDFYYARPIENKVQNTLEALRDDMTKGRYDDTLLYVLGKDQLPLYKDFDLHFYEIEGRYLASHEAIDGLKE